MSAIIRPPWFTSQQAVEAVQNDPQMRGLYAQMRHVLENDMPQIVQAEDYKFMISHSPKAWEAISQLNEQINFRLNQILTFYGYEQKST